MNIGQRIAQKRKELGLSQEALGDQLGVSRQSIYKWESNSALPEIDKLIALAALFGVSVGWLLGVEDPSPEPAGQQESDLSEAQLKMVEEIVARYLAAQPTPNAPPRRKWPVILSLFVLLIAGFSLVNRLDRISQQYDRVQMAVSNVQSSVNSQINGISSRVEDILKAQNALTAEYGTEIAAADLGRNTITFSAHAVPKTYVDGMTAVFLADSGDGPAEYPAELGPGKKFSGEITARLTDGITLSVVFISPDGTRQTQLLDTYEGFFSASLPEVMIRDHFLIGEDAPGGTLTLESFYFTIENGKPSKALGDQIAEVAEVKVGFFRNQKLLAWAQPSQQPGNYQGNYDGEQFYRVPDMTVENLTAADKLAVAALVTDSFGRQFIACDIPYVVNFDTDRDPYLTYPSDGRYDRDPAAWTFE